MPDEEVIQPPQEPTQDEKDAALWEELEVKAKELSAKNNNRTILPFIVIDRDDSGGDRLVGYMFEIDPMTDAKLYAAQLTGAEAAVLKALQGSESLVLWNDSDPRLNSKKYRKGVALNILAQVEGSVPLLKKK